MSARKNSIILSVALPILLLVIIFASTAHEAEASYWSGWGYAITADFNGSDPDVQLHYVVVDSSGSSYSDAYRLDCLVEGSAIVDGGLYVEGDGWVSCEVPALQEIFIEYTASLGTPWESIQVSDSLGGLPFYAGATVSIVEDGNWVRVIEGLDGDVSFLYVNDYGSRDMMNFAMDDIYLGDSNPFDSSGEYDSISVSIYETPCHNQCSGEYYFNHQMIGTTINTLGEFSPSNWENGGEIRFGEGATGTIHDAVWDPFCGSTNPTCG